MKYNLSFFRSYSTSAKSACPPGEKRHPGPSTPLPMAVGIRPLSRSWRAGIRASPIIPYSRPAAIFFFPRGQRSSFFSSAHFSFSLRGRSGLHAQQSVLFPSPHHPQAEIPPLEADISSLQGLHCPADGNISFPNPQISPGADQVPADLPHSLRHLSLIFRTTPMKRRPSSLPQTSCSQP